MDRYVIRGGREGAARLRVLERNWASSTEALFDRVGVAPGGRCLDLGCGAGDVTVRLARRVGLHGRVVGIDMDAGKLDAAGEHARAAGVSAQTEFVLGNAYDPAGDEGNDIVYCRFLLQHMSRPVEVLQRMWESVALGGAIVVEDADFDAQFCYPPHPAFDFWMQCYPAVLRRAGGDPQIGRKLAALFAEAGIPAPQLTISQRAHLTGEEKTLPLLTIDATASTMRELHIATDGEIRDALRQLRELADDASILFGSPRTCQAWSRRS